ncbi:MAG TPA: carboxypeptidase regulatory-like domain-containing protein [Terriglobales bacterium]|nr:carboxypeptidase regulatory-like domain-containing protein [Terriglobales bacterium]
MRVYSALRVLLAIATFFCSFQQMFAQGSTGNSQLNGTVIDPTGSIVVGAAIVLHNAATDVSFNATSNERGFYAFANVPPGTYELKVSSKGFANYTQTGVVLTVGQTATVNISLKVASAGETVVVTTEAPTIETTRSEISQVISTHQVDSLPISNRVFTDFALLTPGVASSRTSLGTTFTEFEVTQISFGGMRSFSNMISVDGADFVNSASGIQRSTPPQEAVQEFRVVNNNFGADYGRAVGGIVNIVTKSGTNVLHGSAYEYFQNSATNARSLLQPAPLPNTLRQNQFGATLGGPLVKDRTFFFLNYEGKRSAQSPVYPPDLVNNIQVIDQAKALMGLAPEACLGALQTCLPNFAGNPANITQDQAFGFLKGFLKTGNDDFGFARVDHQLTTNNRLAVRYNVEDIRSLNELVGSTLDGGGIGVPSGGRNLYVRDQSVVATVNTLFSNNIVNTALAQYARRHYNFNGATGQPDFSILNDLELGHNFGTNDRLYETRVQASDSVSWVKGTHVVRFGVDINWLSSLENFPGFTPVRLLVPGVTCLANFAEYFNRNYGGKYPTAGTGLDALAGFCPVPQDNGVVFTYAGTPLPPDPTACSSAPCAPTVTTANPLNGGGFPSSTWANAYPPQFFNRYSRLIDHEYWGAFVQDQWRINPKLTLNYGLRWDAETGLSAFVVNDFTGFQPRLGFAYSPDSKTVIRGGFGLFYDRQNLTFFFVPNTQKIVAGYQCGNHAPANIAAICSGKGILPQQFPNIMSNLGQANQGYQLLGVPPSPGNPGSPCAGIPQAPCLAANIIQTGAYNTAVPEVSMAGTCFTTGACGIGEGGMERNSKLPYAEQASLEIDRQFGKGFSINLGYLFVGAHRLVRGNNINIPCPVGTTKSAPPTDPLPEWMPGLLNADGTLSPCTGTPTLGTGALAGLGPFFGGVFGSGLQTLSGGLEDYNNNVANANYHGGTITAIERIRNFQMTANYTYSHTIDDGNFTTFINLPVNQFDYTAERANSNQDARHRFVVNFTATAPKTGWWRNFALSSIITLQSGRPFTLFYGNGTLNDIAAGATDRVGGAPMGSSCPSVDRCQTMIPRNTYTGDTLYSWDLRLARDIHLSERMQLNLAFDAFNLLNRPNVDEVTSVYGSPVFCGAAIPGHYNDATTRAIQQSAVACPVGDGLAIPGVGSFASTPITAELGSTCSPPNVSPLCIFIPANPNPNFGRPRTMFNPRQLQFSVKFTF